MDVRESTDDPFEAFNRAMGAGLVQNPYPEFAEMRRQGPLYPADIRSLMGLDADADLGDMGELPDIWTVSSYDAVHEVLKDGARFSSAGYAEVMGAVMGHTILEMDEPEHHTYRSLIQQAFTRKEMDLWQGELVLPIVDELIDGFVDDGRADLVSRLFFPFPVNVIAGLLGLPRADLPQFHRWTVELIGVSVDFARAVTASESLRDYLGTFIHERRARPERDMISVLAETSLNGQRLTDDEILAFCRLLLPAGAETTYRSSSNLVFGLLTHPAQLDSLRDDRGLLTQAIEEGLRWEPPLLTIMRTATVDTDVCGVAVAKGAVLVVNMGAANHDGERWERPDEFDIFRPQQPHIAFAFGPHMCLGMHLARMETRVVVNRLLDRLPGMRLDPDAEPPYITGMTFRSPPALPIVF